MTTPTRDSIFAQAAAKLRHDLEEIRGTVPHRGLAGDEAAGLVKKFLNDHLPKRFSAGNGFTIDRNNQLSRQTDVVIYDALNCPAYRASEEAGIYPADNVAAAVEVKSTLDKQKLEEAFANIASAKGLSKTKEPDWPFPTTAQTLGCVFAFRSDLTLDTLQSHYHRLLREGGLGRHVDLVLVLDRGVIFLAVKPPAIVPGGSWAPVYLEGLGGPAAEGSHLAAGAMEAGEASLDIFLRMLLLHLSIFRPIVDHPGFTVGNPMKVVYLASITLETDSDLKRQKLDAYRQEVEDDFRRRQADGGAG